MQNVKTFEFFSNTEINEKDSTGEKTYTVWKISVNTKPKTTFVFYNQDGYSTFSDIHGGALWKNIEGRFTAGGAEGIVRGFIGDLIDHGYKATIVASAKNVPSASIAKAMKEKIIEESEDNKELNINYISGRIKRS